MIELKRWQACVVWMASTIARLIIVFGGRRLIGQWLRDEHDRKRAELLANVRAAHRDRDRFEEAAALVHPLLQANPTWKWGDAVAHLRASGADLPIGNPYLEQLDMKISLEKRGER
jgi:hypothetical protein